MAATKDRSEEVGNSSKLGVFSDAANSRGIHRTPHSSAFEGGLMPATRGEVSRLLAQSGPSSLLLDAPRLPLS